MNETEPKRFQVRKVARYVVVDTVTDKPVDDGELWCFVENAQTIADGRNRRLLSHGRRPA